MKKVLFNTCFIKVTHICIIEVHNPHLPQYQLTHYLYFLSIVNKWIQIKNTYKIVTYLFQVYLKLINVYLKLNIY